MVAKILRDGQAQLNIFVRCSAGVGTVSLAQFSSIAAYLHVYIQTSAVLYTFMLAMVLYPHIAKKAQDDLERDKIFAELNCSLLDLTNCRYEEQMRYA